MKTSEVRTVPQIRRRLISLQEQYEASVRSLQNQISTLGQNGWDQFGRYPTNYSEFQADGTLQMYGTARVALREWTSANGIRAKGVSPATETLNGAGYSVISFADNKDNWVQYNLLVPPQMDRSADSYLCIGWSSPTISQTAIIDLHYLISAADDDTDQAGVANLGNALTSSATADGLVISLVVTIAGGTITADDVCIHVQMMRDGNNALDTLGDVLELHGVALQYTANKLGT